MKRYLCGILIICILFAPFTGFAEEVLDTNNDATDVGTSHGLSDNEQTNTTPAVTSTNTTYSVPKIIINEIMVGSEVNPIKDVWVELYNPGAQDVNLNGWGIKGVTSGGRWISISDTDLAIGGNGYSLISYYTNSKSSALNIKPDIQKSSLAFPNDLIEIELKDPNENIVDKIKINYEKLEEYKSYERNAVATDGQLPGSWARAGKQINLKDNLLKTFATPGSKNSCVVDPVINPVIGISNDIITDQPDVGTSHGLSNNEQIYTAPADTTTDATETTSTNSDVNDGGTDVGGTNILPPDNQTSILPVNTITNTAIPNSDVNDENQTTGTTDASQTTQTTSTTVPNSNVNSDVPDDVGTSHGLSDDEQIDTTPTNASIQPTETTSTNSDVNDGVIDVGNANILPPDNQTSILPVNTITDTQQPADVNQNSEIELSSNHESIIENRESTSGTRNIEPISYPTYQLINEFMPNPQGSDTNGEWVELFNNTSVAIDLSGWYLDDADGASSPYKIKDNTVLGANTYLIFSAPDLDISLKNTDDQVRLLAPDKSAKEIINYFGAKEDFSYAKKMDGSFEWTSIPTSGAGNRFPEAPKSYLADDIVFKNVLPNPDGKDDGSETITLKNNLSENITMNGWSLKNEKGIEFNMTGISINSYSKLTFHTATIGLTLTNTSDQLSLIDPSGNLIDRINWFNAENGKLIYKSDFFKDGSISTVTKIIDGDTFAATIGDEQFTIRLIGVDTPETVHPKKQIEEYGKKASEYLSGLLTNQTVKLNFDDTKMDTYNRLLAYVYLGEKFINAEIIKNGYGYAYTKFPFRYQNDFVSYEKEAKTGNLGIWQSSMVDVILAGDSKNIIKSDELLENDESIENDEKTDSPIVGDAHVRPTITQNTLACPTTGLKIDSIMPNPDKTSIEYVKIINTDTTTICLNGWQLDDQIGQGSKPFQIKGGAIEAGAIRTFFKDETKIALNNSNDCANLINPLGDVTDSICYSKTHAGEIFTHDGGNWVNSVGDGHVRPTKTTATPFTRSAENYQWDLKNETLNGKVAFVYDEGKVLYLQDNAKIIPVSYANSKIDINMAKQMVNFGGKVALDVHSTAESKQLIGIKQINEVKKETIKNKNISKIPIEYIFIIFTALSMGILFYLYLSSKTPKHKSRKV